MDRAKSLDDLPVEPATGFRRYLELLYEYKGALIGFILWFIFLFVRINKGDPQSTEQSLTIGVTLLMIVWWLTETVPIAITALIPIVLFPLEGILDTATVCAQYANNITFLLLGSFFMAVAMEKWNLHLRLVYNLLITFGTGRRKILAAFMLITAILSAVMSNVTTALIMLPIIDALARNVQTSKQVAFIPERLERAYLLGILLAANIGGTLTPIGTPPNLVMIRLLHITYPLSNEISFLVWMAYAVPLGIFFGILCFLYINWRYFGMCRSVKDEELIGSDGYQKYEDDEDDEMIGDVKDVLERKLANLGPMKFAEKYVAATFCFAIFLWIFRADFDLAPHSDCRLWRGCMPGWHRIYTSHLNETLYNPTLTAEEKGNFVEDAVPAILLSIPLFLLPALDGKGSPYERNYSYSLMLIRILNWKSAVDVPWDILWLVGGGFALAKAIEDTGLSRFFADGLNDGLGDQDKVLVLWIFVLVIILLATVSSNFAMAAIIVPVFGAFAVDQGVNPIYYCVPATIALSYCFILPTSSPVNAVIFSTKKVTMATMAKHGAALSALAWLLIFICWLAYGQFAYQANNFEREDWYTAEELTNTTLRDRVNITKS